MKEEGGGGGEGELQFYSFYEYAIYFHEESVAGFLYNLSSLRNKQIVGPTTIVFQERKKTRGQQRDVR